MTHAINIEGIKLYAYHGCLEEESRIGGNYIVDVYMITDFSEAAKTDDLTKTIDYCTVYEISKAQMAIRIVPGEMAEASLIKMEATNNPSVL